ncbi:MAG: hypothetical protein HY591_03085, partial [Candidatus Omnitrophica bacterium]|nr:hypothetical protein [Candidatus Omnitrophota bacterium]
SLQRIVGLPSVDIPEGRLNQVIATLIGRYPLLGLELLAGPDYNFELNGKYAFVVDGQELPKEEILLLMHQRLSSNQQLSIVDKAAVVQQKTQVPGGIDFQSDKMNVQTQTNSGEVKFHVDRAMLQRLQNAHGFEPVIVKIQSMRDLRMFLDELPLTRFL